MTWQYRPVLQCHSAMTVLGKTAALKVDLRRFEKMREHLRCTEGAEVQNRRRWKRNQVVKTWKSDEQCESVSFDPHVSLYMSNDKRFVWKDWQGLMSSSCAHSTIEFRTLPRPRDRRFPSCTKCFSVFKVSKVFFFHIFFGVKNVVKSGGFFSRRSNAAGSWTLVP